MKTKMEQLQKSLAESLDRMSVYLAGKCQENGKISTAKMDENQLVQYTLAWLTAQSNIAEHFLETSFQSDSGAGELEQNMAALFLGETANQLLSELTMRGQEYGLSPADVASLWPVSNIELIQEMTMTSRYDAVAQQVLEGNWGHTALTEDQKMLQDTFRSFADEQVAPLAEHVHRTDDFVPESILSGLLEMGAFGLAIPGEHGGYLDEYGNMGTMIVTEELSRGSLSIAGSLITRPEILSKAILKGGTQEQKQKWLSALASGEKMCAVAVTEPNYGSDVAGMKVAAEKTEGGWLLNGVKTWCTFAGYADTIMVLARTEKDPSLKHRGLSILIAEKPRDTGHKFETKQESGGSMSGSAIGTIGYRGMHSFEVNFDNYFVPDENLIGGEEGRGKGFYLQMAGFAGGRIQTAARANGVMQAALEAAVRYSRERKVFNKEIGEYQMTRWKLARMAMLLLASRQYSYHVAYLMDKNEGSMEATLIKFYASKISEWVTREAMQIHGGMGYAEEYAVSRYFVDARVFSIFEGAEEVMALRVCARDILNQALQKIG